MTDRRPHTSLDLLTYKESAEVLRISERTVRRLVHDRMVAVTEIGRKRFITREALQDYISSNQSDHERTIMTRLLSDHHVDQGTAVWVRDHWEFPDEQR